MPNQIAFYPQSSGGSGAVTLIQTQMVASPVASITFSAIPQTFKHLRLVVNFATATGTNLKMNFNADTTAAHYAYGLLFQNNGAAAQLSNNSAAAALVGASGGTVVLDIPGYTAGVSGGVNWTGTWGLFAIGSATLNGAAAGLWLGTDVTSIALADAGGSNISAGSIFSLYGSN